MIMFYGDSWIYSLPI